MSGAEQETRSEKGPSPVFDVISLFPEMFDALAHYGISRRALENGLWHLATWNPRDFAEDHYRTVDDRPYGGGPGMVMLPAPLEKAIAAAKQRQRDLGLERSRVVHFSPQGRPLDHATVMRRHSFSSPGHITTRLGMQARKERSKAPWWVAPSAPTRPPRSMAKVTGRFCRATSWMSWS